MRGRWAPVFGFTLTEILIVITIIGVLAGTGFLAVPTQLNKAWDARRKSDISQFKIAFENYYNEKTCYPTMDLWNSAVCGSPVSFLASSFSNFPCDPLTRQKYLYQTTSADGSQCTGVCGQCHGYRLLARLANAADPDIERVGCDTDSCGIIPASGGCPNWGIAMGATVFSPTFIPNQQTCRLNGR